MSKRSHSRRTMPSSTKLFIKQGLIGGGLVVVLTLLFTGIWYGTRLETVTIVNVDVRGGDTVDARRVQEVVEAELEGAYFRLIPRRFTWMYPETEIKATISDRFERMSNLSVVRAKRTLHVEYAEHVPVALWCTDEHEPRCLFLNEYGYAFAVAPTLSGGSFTRYTTVDRVPERGAHMVEIDVLAQIMWFSRNLTDVLSLYPSYVQIYPDDRVTYKLNSGAAIYTSLRHDVTDTFRYLETLLVSADFAHLLDAEFQYIDLRFGNKLFVNETEAATSTTVATGAEEGVATTANLPDSEVGTDEVDTDIDSGSAEPIDSEVAGITATTEDQSTSTSPDTVVLEEREESENESATSSVEIVEED